MPPYDPEVGSGYGKTVKYRIGAARMAAKYGAVAALVRSVTATSLRTPHTGAMSYGDATQKIPTAAITTEDADRIARLGERGVAVEVLLKMSAQTLPDAKSANVIAELVGTELRHALFGSPARQTRVRLSIERRGDLVAADTPGLDLLLFGQVAGRHA